MALYSGYHVKILDSNEKKSFVYILRHKPNFRRKIKILKQSHSVEKGKRGHPLGYLKLHFVTKYQNVGNLKGRQSTRKGGLSAPKALLCNWKPENTK